MTRVQLEFDFESKKFDILKEAVVHSVFSSQICLKTLAARLDHSPSNLSRRLSLVKLEGEPALTVEDFERIIEETKDFTPIYYLVEKFLKKENDILLKEFQDFKKKIPEIERFLSMVKGR